jgi:hypothetical protein
MTDKEYFNALPASGLDLAEECLSQDLMTLRDNGLPAEDTIAGLITVRYLQVEQSDEETDEEAE